MSKLRSVSLVAVAFVFPLAGAGCGAGEDVTTRSLANARRTWEAAKIRDYNLEW